jgi:hypothetical protein
MAQFDGRVVLFLDNLESLQDDDTLAVNDPTVAAWLSAAQATEGLTLLVTSRWVPPNWRGTHLPLDHAHYGDFLQMAQSWNIPATLSQNRDRLRRAYAALGGNPRGLEFFAAAALGMKTDEEQAFLETLEKTKSELQANMAIEAIYNRLPADAKQLLARLPAYREPVPAEGILKLGMDLPNPESFFERLLAVSLLEVSYQPDWDATEYQLPPLVSDWLSERGLADANQDWLNAAADYHLYLLRHERHTLPQAIATHHALRRAPSRSRPPHAGLYRGAADDSGLLHGTPHRMATAHP